MVEPPRPDPGAVARRGLRLRLPHPAAGAGQPAAVIANTGYRMDELLADDAARPAPRARRRRRSPPSSSPCAAATSSGCSSRPCTGAATASTYPVEVRMQLVGSETPPVIAAVVLDITRPPRRRAGAARARGREPAPGERAGRAAPGGDGGRAGGRPPVRVRPGVRGGRAADRRGERRPGALRGGPPRRTVVGSWGLAGRPRTFPPRSSRSTARASRPQVSRTGRPMRDGVGPRRRRRGGGRRGAGARRRPPLGRHRRLGHPPRPGRPRRRSSRLGRFAELVGIAVSNAEGRGAPGRRWRRPTT